MKISMKFRQNESKKKIMAEGHYFLSVMGSKSSIVGERNQLCGFLKEVSKGLASEDTKRN